MNRRARTVREFCEIFGIGLNQGYQAIHEGKIPHVKIGKRIIIPDAVIENLLQEAKEEEGGAAA